MAETGQAGQPSGVATCGCASEMRRVCDLCDPAGAVFVACSSICLDRHLTEQHDGNDDARESTKSRAHRYLAHVNRRLTDSVRRYAEHRNQVMALALPTETSSASEAKSDARDIAIFGAGNGTDLDLERLANTFREVHLVDLDGEALERARQDLPARLRDQVIPHASVDLSGFMSHLDAWGESFPDDATLGRSAFDAARAIAAGLGRDFDVVLSTGVLSQLIVPFHRAWITSQLNWQRLDAAIIAVHLATLVQSTRSGGRCVLVFDVLSSKRAPWLTGLVGRETGEIETAVDTEVAAGNITLQPHPMALLQQLQFPGMASMVREPRLTAPWLWNLGDAVQLVYGLSFRRP